jgi:outer membrane protein OmpA-like peptidoglycan-associated protein
MLISGIGGQPKGARDRVQANRIPVAGTSGPRCRSAPAGAAALGLLLAGCSSFPSSMNPVTWWHDLQGGKIAEQRPPPPGADQPYPNLASVPAKPAEPDRAALTNIANALIADRTNTQHADAAAPIADPSSPNASPALFGKGTVPPPPPPPPPGIAPPGTPTASASLPAADAPPAPPATVPLARLPQSSSQASVRPGPAPAPAKAPVGAVQTAELPPPDVAAPAAGGPPPPGDAAPTTPATAAPLAPPGAAAQPTAQAAPSPALPTAPPPPPNLSSSAPAAPSSTVPAAPGAPAAPAPATAGPAGTVSVTFVSGSADLPTTAASTLKTLAAQRGNGIIAVTGYGDADSNNPDAQSAALKLGLSRAQAMAAALASAGVPRSAVQVDAEAIGRGGAARLVK